jgi:SUMO ligase MMS21 Smc5/6 complex component
MNGRDLIKEQFTSYKKIAFEQYLTEGKNQFLAPSLKCSITGKRLVTPILMKNCIHPGTHVDYDEVYNLLKANEFKFEKLLKPCSTCDAPISFDDYLYDELFGSLLNKLKNIHIDKGVKFDITKKKFVEMPSEEIP